jgi:hypothetical protein
LKTGGRTPSTKARDTARPLSEARSDVSPLTSLLQAVSRAAASTDFRHLPGLSS